MDERQKKLKGIASYFKDPQYDSDEELEPKVQEAIKRREEKHDFDYADKIREAAWNDAGAYPKLKRMVKGVWYGDKRDKK